jgi:DNA polymerase-3 subunit beta
MQFEIQRENLLRALRVVSGGVDKKNAINSPMLSGVFLSVQAGSLFFVTTDQDLEMTTQAILEGEVVPGKLVICFRKLIDICRALPEGGVLSVKQVGDKISIQSGRSKYSLGVLSADNFPTFHRDAPIASLTSSKKMFRQFIENACFAIADQDVRLYLNGLLLELNGQTLCAVASDGHRLALSVLPLPGTEGVRNSFRILLPKKAVLECLRVLDNTEGSVLFEVGTRYFRLLTGNHQITAHLLEAKFPEYRRLIPEAHLGEMSADKQRLKEAFNRVAALFSDRFRAVRLKLLNHRLILTAATAESDQVEEDIDVEYSGEPFEIVFNIKYLLDCLQAISHNRVRFLFSGLNSSAKLQGDGCDDSLYVIMPMKF